MTRKKRIAIRALDLSAADETRLLRALGLSGRDAHELCRAIARARLLAWQE